MFDMGFWEVCLIGVIALLVLGPERLPVAARTVGRWIGKAKRTVSHFKDEIDRELKLDELKRQVAEHEANLKKEIDKSGIRDFAKEAQDTVQQAQSTLQAKNASEQSSPAAAKANDGNSAQISDKNRENNTESASTTPSASQPASSHKPASENR